MRAGTGERRHSTYLHVANSAPSALRPTPPWTGGMRVAFRIACAVSSGTTGPDGGFGNAITSDGYVETESIRRKIDGGEVFVAEVDGERAGYLRVEFLWSIQPYVALIRVLERYRGKGLSRSLLEYLETDLRREGHEVLFSSSQVDGAEPQSWHRHMGFEECGILTGLNEGGVGEVFFRKALR